MLTDPGDEVILTDPTYAGMLQRVRLVGAVPRLVPLRGDASGWRLDLEALAAAVSDRTRVLFLMNPAIPSGWVANDDEWAAVTASAASTGSCSCTGRCGRRWSSVDVPSSSRLGSMGCGI